MTHLRSSATLPAAFALLLATFAPAAEIDGQSRIVSGERSASASNDNGGYRLESNGDRKSVV